MGEFLFIYLFFLLHTRVYLTYFLICFLYICIIFIVFNPNLVYTHTRTRTRTHALLIKIKVTYHFTIILLSRISIFTKPFSNWQFYFFYFFILYIFLIQTVKSSITVTYLLTLHLSALRGMWRILTLTIDLILTVLTLILYRYYYYYYILPIN